MREERILVLDADSNAGLAVVQSLGAAGYACVVAATTTDAPAFTSRWGRDAVTYPDPMSDAPAFKSWLQDWVRAHPVALVIPCTERTLVPLHELRDDPVLAPLAAIPSREALDAALDKERLRSLASSLGVPVPASSYVTKLEELDDAALDIWLAEGAAVVKTVRSKTWRGSRAYEFPTVVVRDRDALRAAVAERVTHVPVQVQQWVPGRGLALALLARDGEIVLSVAHERLHEVPLTGGGSSYRRTIETPPALYEDSRKLVAALGYNGVAMVEFRGDLATGRRWLMEINARFWGSLPLAIFAGADFPRALVGMTLHGEIPSGPPPRANVYARQLERDVHWLRLVLKHRGKFAPYELHEPIGASLLQWGRVLTGRETWDGARLDDPRPLLREVAHLVEWSAGTVAEKARRTAIQRSARRSSLARARQFAEARRVLLLCHGNICRSPYAAARLAGGAHELRSAGFHPTPDRETPDDFAAVAAVRGVDLRAHRSRVVGPDDLAWADVIVVMDQRNYDRLRALDRKSLRKVVWLGALDGEGIEIADPYGEPAPVMEAVLARMDRCLERLARG